MGEAGLEMKTLKVSEDTLRELRTPFVWNRPRAKLYDYHNEIGGLYYQPMISYIRSREAGGQRQTVQVPDRIQSNFDRIVYRRKHEEEDMQDFLTMYYARRLKDVNSKTVHVKNELMRWSKDPKSLNMVRGSANIRDRYLCKLQLLHTEHQAAEARRRAEAGELDELELVDDDLPVIHSGKEVGLDKYEPGYEKFVEDREQILREKLMRKKEYYAIDKAMKERMAAVMDRTKHLNKMTHVMQELEGSDEGKQMQSVQNMESSSKNVTTKSYKMEWHSEGGHEFSQSFADKVGSEDEYLKSSMRGRDEIAKNYKIDAEENEEGVAAIGNMEKKFERAARKANIYSRGQLNKPKVKYTLPRW